MSNVALSGAQMRGAADDASGSPATRWPPLLALAVTAPLVPLLLYMDTAFAGLAGWLWHGGVWLDGAALAKLSDLERHCPEVVSSLISQGLAFAIIVLLAGLGGSQARREILLFERPRQGVLASAALPFVFVAASIALLILVTKILPYTTQDALKVDALIANSRHGYLVFAMYVIGAPLAEEFLFRGFLRSSLTATRLGSTGAGLVTSLLWMQIHWWGPAPMLLHIFGMGLLLSLIARHTGSIWMCVACHALWNGVAFLLLLNRIA